ncbi:MAG: hypothetical protein V4678_02930 [Patescibacteria group bacterium]
MEPTERTYNPNPNPTPTPAPVTPTKVKRKRPFGWILLSLLLLIATAVLGYFLYMSTIDSTKSEEQLTASKAKVTDLEKQLNSLASAPAEVTDSAEDAKTDQEAIIETASSHVRAQSGSENATVNVDVLKLEGNFARAGVNVVGKISGQSCIFEKSDDMWLQLYCAQAESEETQRLDALYGVPKSIIQS